MHSPHPGPTGLAGQPPGAPAVAGGLPGLSLVGPVLCRGLKAGPLQAIPCGRSATQPPRTLSISDIGSAWQTAACPLPLSLSLSLSLPLGRFLGLAMSNHLKRPHFGVPPLVLSLSSQAVKPRSNRGARPVPIGRRRSRRYAARAKCGRHRARCGRTSGHLVPTDPHFVPSPNIYARHQDAARPAIRRGTAISLLVFKLCSPDAGAV